MVLGGKAVSYERGTPVCGHTAHPPASVTPVILHGVVFGRPTQVRYPRFGFVGSSIFAAVSSAMELVDCGYPLGIYLPVVDVTV